MKIKHPALTLAKASLLFCSDRCRRLYRLELARHGSTGWADDRLPTGRPRDQWGRPFGSPACFTCGDDLARLAGNLHGVGSPANTGAPGTAASKKVGRRALSTTAGAR